MSTAQTRRGTMVKKRINARTTTTTHPTPATARRKSTSARKASELARPPWHLSKPGWFEQPAHLIDFLAVHAPQYDWFLKGKYAYPNMSPMRRARRILRGENTGPLYEDIDDIHTPAQLERRARELSKQSGVVDVYEHIHQLTLQWMKHHYTVFSAKITECLMNTLVRDNTSEVYREVMRRASSETQMVNEAWLKCLASNDSILPFQPYLVWFWVMFQVGQHTHKSVQRKRLFRDLQRWLLAK